MKGALLLFGIVAIYLIPTIIAYSRTNESRRFILFLNLFLGWSAVCWAWAFFWSLIGDSERPRKYRALESSDEDTETPDPDDDGEPMVIVPQLLEGQKRRGNVIPFPIYATLRTGTR